MNKLKLILAGNINKSIEDNLKKEGFEIFKSPKNTNVLKGLSYHPDMQIVKIDNYYVADPYVYEYYKDIFKHTSQNLVCGKTHSSSNYPKDIAYNIKVINDTVFHNFKYTDEEVKAKLCGKKTINVSQGYSGCSICTAGDNAIITADTAIHSSALQNGIDSLIISPGYIKLEGFDYGFIGGASFKSANKLYFFGDASTHPDYHNIESFCRKHNTEICFLSDGVLCDYGSAVTID